MDRSLVAPAGVGSVRYVNRAAGLILAELLANQFSERADARDMRFARPASD
jgi:hypothetical protein